MMLRACGLATLLLCAAVSAGERGAVILWHDPGVVSKIDLGGDVGTGIPAPKPPFKFIKEDSSGTQSKILLKDAAGRTWDAKFGYEVKPESFACLIPAAVGYFVEPSYYVRDGQIPGMTAMKRASPSVQPDGRFKDARFQIRDANFKYVDHETWKWKANPFAGTKELKGLEILIMLASNWDNKDGTSGPGESNTGVFERHLNGRTQKIYAFTDWGSGMGKWGDKAGQTDWNCRDYTTQTAEFVKGVAHGDVVFGYEGHHNDDFKTHIRPADIAWLMSFLGQITDVQLHAALRVSGATPQEEDCFAKAIRARINQLAAAAKLGSAATN